MIILNIKTLIDTAMAREATSLVIKNANLIATTTREILPNTDIMIKGKYIVGIGKAEENHINDETIVIDAEGLYVSPGLIDSHIHVESSMSSPTSFAEAVIPHGTTTTISDPHEIGNVLGIKGVELMIEEASNLPMDILFVAPSCVPSLPGMETPGAVINSKDIKTLMNNPKIFGLAEVMNFPGVFMADKEVLAKINHALDCGKIIDGHAPGLTGNALNAYISAQIKSDHECETAEEAIEKLNRGMHIQIREGSFTKNMNKLILGLRDKRIDLRKCSVVSDDRHPDDLLFKGHLDYSLKKLVKVLNMDPIEALQLVTINPAENMELKNIGIVAPGKIANIAIFEDLQEFKVKYTIFEGSIVAKDGKLVKQLKPFSYPNWALDTTKNLKVPTVDQLKVSCKKKVEKVKVNVIKILEHTIVTEKSIEELNVKDKFVIPEVNKDVLPIAVIDRHSGKNNIGVGFVSGLGLKDGAIATTVAHDCHQLIVAGTSYEMMVMAVEKIKSIGGGYVVVNSQGFSTLPLPYGGIMSTKPLKELVENLKEIRETLKIVKSSISEPMMALSFMSLPVIPKIKLTDKGLFDSENFKQIDVIL